MPGTILGTEETAINRKAKKFQGLMKLNRRHKNKEKL